MRCSCKACGAYMVQREKGLESGCRCPQCGNVCRDCMGSVHGPLSVEGIRARFQGGIEDSFLAKSEDTLREQAEQPVDWRRML